VHLWLYDLSWVIASPVVALYVRDAGLVSRAEWEVFGNYWLFSACFTLVAFFAFRIQHGITPHFSVHDALDVIEAVIFAELMICVVLFSITRLDGIPRSIPLIHGLLLAAGLLAIRMFTRLAHSEAAEPLDYYDSRERIILIGANRFASYFIKMLHAYTPQKQRVIAILEENESMIGQSISGVQVLGAPRQLDAMIREFAIHGVGVERIVIAGEQDFLSHPALHEVQRVCEKRQIGLAFLPRMLGLTEWKPSKPILQSTSQTAQETLRFQLPRYFWTKRWIDIVGALALILMFFPVLLLGCLLTVLDVGFPILFWQERIGRNGRPFLIYKFRTLRAPFDSRGNPTLDARQPSAIGRLLRATRIDELPQILNVLFGDMSLIGPRPLLPEDQPSNAHIRLMVRPGITGWAQVNGGKLVTKEEKGRFDEWYIRNASLWLDLQILMMTLKIIFKTHASSQEASVDAEQAGRPRQASSYRNSFSKVAAPDAPIQLVHTVSVPTAAQQSASDGKFM